MWRSVGDDSDQQSPPVQHSENSSGGCSELSLGQVVVINRVLFLIFGYLSLLSHRPRDTLGSRSVLRSDPSATKMNLDEPLHVAIIGGGIAGLCLGIGLQARNINFTIYERASGLHEIGAGIGLSPNAEWAMKCLDKRVHQAYETVANHNAEDYFQWINGLNNELIFKLHVGEGCFRGCRRSDYLEELVKCLPKEKIKFEKQLRSIRQEREGSVVMEFEDGTSESADAGEQLEASVCI